MKSNVAYLIYDTLRAHFIYLNYALFKKKTEEEHHGVDMSVLVDENIEEPKRTLLEAIFDDYTINCDTVDIQEVFKGMTEAMSKAPNLIEKNSTDFHNIFMRFMEHEYYHYFENKNVLINMKEIEEEVHNKNKQADLLEM